MSAKTRFGFGGDGPEPLPPGSAAGRPTRVGHDLHVPGPGAPDPVRATPAPPEPARRTPTPAPPRRPTPGRARDLPGAPAPRPTGTPAPRPASAVARARTPTPRPSSTRPRRGTGPLPAMARFFGRRNTVGDIVPLTETELRLPPEGPGRWLRPVLTILVAAACSFIVIGLVMWLLGPAPR